MRIVLVGLWLGLCLFTPVYAQTGNIHLSWASNKTPDPAHIMAVTWNSAKPNNGIVRYGLDSLRFKHQVKSAGIKVKGGNDSSYNYKAEIGNLIPETRYYYQCGSEGGGWGAVYSFKTAPLPGKKGKFTIGVWGDTQNNTGNLAFEQTSNIVNQLAKFPLDLSIHMGDIVENGSVENSWFNFFKTAQPVTSKAPFMPVVGNHDVINNTGQINFQKPFQIFYDSFQLPNQCLNYSYDYGNIHFVAVNSGFAQGAAKVGKVLLDQNSPDYIWLEKDLAAARKNKSVTWIILYTHYPVYSFGVSHIPEWQHNLSPILDKYKVDLCLSGHRHVYERHKAIRANAQEDLKFGSYYDHPNGTVYITNGSSGGSLQGVGGFNMSSIVFTPKEKTFTYAIMTVEGNSIQYDVYDQNDQKIDFFKIVK